MLKIVAVFVAALAVERVGQLFDFMMQLWRIRLLRPVLPPVVFDSWLRGMGSSSVRIRPLLGEGLVGVT